MSKTVVCNSDESDTPTPLAAPSEKTGKQTSRARRLVIATLRVCAAVYLGLLLVLVAMESRLLFPGAYMKFQPIRSTLVQPLPYRNDDGRILNGRLYEHPGATRTVLFLHGNATTATRQDDWITRLGTQLNANVCAAEYAGFCYDDITPHESNLIADAIAAHDAVRARFQLQPDEIIVYGRSLGGGVAAALAQRKQTRCLVLERTFDSCPSVAAAHYPMFPVKLLMRNQFDSCARLKHFPGRLIQIHGTHDEVIPLDHGVTLHDAVGTADKVFIKLERLGHNDPLPGDVIESIGRLIDAKDSSQAD